MITTTLAPLDTIQIRSWRTPLTILPDKTVGEARLKHIRKTRGIYHFEGQKGFEYYQVTKHFMCSYLQRKHGSKWKTWMTDDPTHWIAMLKLSKRVAPGRVLVAGLGLGLIIHHLLRRQDITSITVVELSKDVIKLIKPTLPKDTRIKIVNREFYEFIYKANREDFDAIVWDLAVGMAHETRGHYIYAAVQCGLALPGIPLYQFGLREVDTIFGNNKTEGAAV